MPGPRAVLDNNLPISYLLAAGPTLRRLFGQWADDRFIYVVSPPIVDELRDALARPSIRSRMGVDPAPLLEAIERNAEWTTGELTVEGACRDPKDDKFLACAREGRTAFVVSGDDDLLALRKFDGIRIVTPAQFIAIVDDWPA